MNKDRSGPMPAASPGAALGMAMIADGVDLDDAEAIAAWMEAFNARSYEDRAAILTDDVVGGAPAVPGFDRPLVVDVPTDDEARASAATSPLLDLTRRLVEFIGEGRKLTQTGNVTLADARELVILLETGDRFDEKIGDRTFKTQSAAELSGLSLVVRLATKARFVRPHKGALVATKAGRNLGQDPLADLVRLVKAIDDVGVVSARRAGGHNPWTTLAPFFDDLFVPLTAILLTTSRVDFADLVENAFDEFEAEIELDDPPWDEGRRRDLVESEINTAIKTLETAGIATWASEVETSDRGTPKQVRGNVSLTPAGRRVLFDHLRDAHGLPIDAAAPAELTALDFESLLHASETGSPGEFARFTRELDAWVGTRGDDAPVELTNTARTTSDPATRNIALAVLADRFGPIAQDHVRGLLDDPATRGAALVWLVDLELEPPESLCDPDPAVLVEVLALNLVNRGPGAMTDVFAHTGSPDEQIALLKTLWRQPSPAVAPVLENLGRHHPVPQVAKAARKATMQHATFLANGSR